MKHGVDELLTFPDGATVTCTSSYLHRPQQTPPVRPAGFHGRRVCSAQTLNGAERRRTSKDTEAQPLPSKAWGLEGEECHQSKHSRVTDDKAAECHAWRSDSSPSMSGDSLEGGLEGGRKEEGSWSPEDSGGKHAEGTAADSTGCREVCAPVATQGTGSSESVVTNARVPARTLRTHRTV